MSEKNEIKPFERYYDSPVQSDAQDGSLWRDNVPLPDWFVEPGGDEGYVPYGSTPLMPFDAGVSRHQSATRQQLRALFEAPPDSIPVSAFAQSIIENDFYAGMAYREEKNYSKYAAWLAHYEQQYRDLLQYGYWHDVVLRAEIGKATPSELINLHRHSSIGATTLASLTVPYGYRLDQYPSMMHDVEDAIVEHGGVVIPRNDRFYRKISEPGMHYTVETIGGVSPTLEDIPKTEWQQYQNRPNIEYIRSGLGVMLVTCRQDIGNFQTDRNDQEVVRCNVAERRSLAIVTDDQLGFPRSLLRPLEEIPRGRRFNGAWKFICDHVLQTNAQVPYVVPISSTIFAHRVEAAREVSSPDLRAGLATRAAFMMSTDYDSARH